MGKAVTEYTEGSALCFLAYSLNSPLLQTSHGLQATAVHGAKMSLIKSADVPKHMADRLRSRRIAARLSGAGGKPILPAKDLDVTAPTVPVEVPAT